MAIGPIVFEPLAMERVWGGRKLEESFGKRLPRGVPIGESWELTDRADAMSVDRDSGTTLHEMWCNMREQIFGARHLANPSQRFPILVKMLDARDKLSVQVHPPASVATSLSGEPKTEVWYFADCDDGALIYAGLRRGITKNEFEAALRDGRVESLLHPVPVKKAESIFIPSGRVHAIGAGNVIIEIQQNSDTTYRVYDWNRPGLDGKPRALHVEESLVCIDFSDYEPTINHVEHGFIADCPHFRVERVPLDGSTVLTDDDDFAIVALAEGHCECGTKKFTAGDFFLLPACEKNLQLVGQGVLLRITLPS